MPDLQLTGFEVLEMLGRGGMATVWKARQVSLDRIVAIKILSSQFASAPEDIDMFQKEARSAAKLKHPGIIQVYDANAENGMYYFVMEYVAGYTVGDWVRRKGVLSEADVMLVAECVADALEYAWDHEKIIHCDIKPDNIMIDADGSVKLADLGLARTISAMSGEEETDEVMGTPAYISPEQAMGKADIDCRADIYSLGAMMYHLLTGETMFRGYTEDEIMQMQVSDTVPDILEENPSVSRGTCWLVEKMLCKDKENRHSSWEQVKKEIAKVKRGAVVRGHTLEEGLSTMQRSEARKVADEVLSNAATHQYMADSDSTGKRSVAVVIILLLLAGAGIGYYLFSRTPKKKARPVPGVHASSQHRSGAGSQTDSSNDNAQEANAKEMYEFATASEKKNPSDFSSAIDSYKKVALQTRGSKYALMAEKDIERLTDALNGKKKEILAKLEMRSQSISRAGHYRAAAEIYQNYSGPYGRETAMERESRARSLVKKAEMRDAREREKQEALARKIEEVYDGVADNLTKGGVSAAQQYLQSASNDPILYNNTDALSDLSSLLEDAAGVSRNVIDSFKGQIGRRVYVQLNSGRQLLQVKAVKNGRVYGEVFMGSGHATSELSFSYADLDVRERLLRMGSDSLPEVALVKGLMALSSGAYDHAKRYFGKTYDCIADRLIKKVDSIVDKDLSSASEKALDALLVPIGIERGGHDPAELATMVAGVSVSDVVAARVRQSAKSYSTLYRESDCAKKYKDAISALSILGTTQHAVAANQKQPPPERRRLVPLPKELEEIEGDLPAIREVFFQKNPRTDPDRIRFKKNGNDKVWLVEIYDKNVDDLAPLAALPDLRSLVYSCGGDDEGMLRNLDPIRSMMLDSLELQNCRVSDLSPLAGLPLRDLSLTAVPVNSASTIRTMPYLESLTLRDTRVSDLSMCKDLALSHLDIGGSKVRSFLFMRAMPLEYVDVSRMDLGTMHLSILETKPLKTFIANGSNLATLSLIENMPLRNLQVSDTGVSDFSPIKGKELHCFAASNTGFSDMELLGGMPLKELYLKGAKISTLKPLSGANLTDLVINETMVKDLGPLTGMQLTVLRCRDTGVWSLDPVKDAPIRDLDVNGRLVSLRLLQTFPALRRINGIYIGGQEGDELWSRLNAAKHVGRRDRRR